MQVPDISKYKKPILIGFAILVVLALLAFGGNKYRKYNKTLLKQAQNALEEQKQASLKREDSLNLLIIEGKTEADEYRILWQDAEIRNARTFRNLKKRINENKKIDTSFVNNANVIVRTVDRQLKDTIE